MLRRFLSYSQKDWSNYLPGLQIAYNKQTQFFVEYRQHTSSIFDFLYSDKSTPNNPATQAFIQDIENSNKIAKGVIQQTSACNDDYHNQNRTERTFEVDDLVMLSTKNVSNKSGRNKIPSPKSLAAIPITKTLAEGKAYRLKLPRELKKIHPVFNVSLLKQFKSDPKGRPTPTKTPILGKESHKSIQDIIAQRMKDNKPQVLVHYKNTDPIEDQ